MSIGLSQDDINNLINATAELEPPKKTKKRKKDTSTAEESSDKNETSVENEISAESEVIESETISLTDLDRDILGEVGNISMGSASTALSNMIAKKVNITTPIVSVTTLKKMRESFEIPNIALEIKYISGIVGKNILLMKITDAAIIANLMMGGDGQVQTDTLSEIEESAVSEAMNQMMGSAATSMATMFAREVNISPPKSKIWDAMTSVMSEDISEDENIIQVAFKLNIENLIDSVIMQVLSVDTMQKIVAIMMGTEATTPAATDTNADYGDIIIESKQESVEKIKEQAMSSVSSSEPLVKEIITNVEPVKENVDLPTDANVQKIEYKQFNTFDTISKNTSSLFDVPLNIQVVLGNAQRSVKEIMNFKNGTLLELNQLANQPVELHVNGKVIAYGEVVVVNDSLGIRIIDINENNGIM